MDSPLEIEDEYLTTAYHAAERAVTIARNRPGADSAERKKSASDIVTKTDRYIEREVSEYISGEYPNHGFIGEEYGEADESDSNWILDPIDGTSNYYYDVFPSCTLIAIEIKGDLHASLTWMHDQDDIYYAVKGKGAYHNTDRISVADVSSISEALLVQEVCKEDVTSVDSPFLQLFRELQRTSGGIRKNRCGGYGFAQTASGGYSGVILNQMGVWDIAPGTLLVREAGGRVTDLDGNEDWERLRQAENGVLATTGGFHDDLLDCWANLNL